MSGDLITLTCGECGEPIECFPSDLRARPGLRIVSPFYVEAWCEQCDQPTTFVHKSMSVKEVAEWMGAA